MGHRRTALIFTSVLTTTTFFLSAAVQAAPVDIIYAAENALYGQGYDIGEADGWLDDKLHTAIRKFQSDHSGLQSSGNLDQATLKALGIKFAGSEISDNQLSGPRATIAKLGLPARHQSIAKATSTTVAAAPEPKLEPKAKAKAKAKTQPAAEPESKPEEPQSTQADDQLVAGAMASDTDREPQQSPPETQPEHAAKAKTTKTPEPAPEPKTISKPEPESKPAPAPEPEQASEQATASAPVQKPDQKSDKTVAMAEPDEKPTRKSTTPAAEEMAQPEQPVEKVTDAESPGASDNKMAANDTSQTVDNNESKSEPEAASTQPADDEEGSKEDSESTGGFFSWLFDFLFGWI